MSKKRSEHQLVGNDDLSLYELGTFCLGHIGPTLYGEKQSTLRQIYGYKAPGSRPGLKHRYKPKNADTESCG